MKYILILAIMFIEAYSLYYIPTTTIYKKEYLDETSKKF